MKKRLSRQRPKATKELIRSALGMLTSKTSVTKALLNERARDKKREETKVKNRRSW